MTMTFVSDSSRWAETLRKSGGAKRQPVKGKTVPRATLVRDRWNAATRERIRPFRYQVRCAIARYRLDAEALAGFKISRVPRIRAGRIGPGDIVG